MKYLDPDGKIYTNKFEKEFVSQVLGPKGVYAYNTTTFFLMLNGSRAGSFLTGHVFYEASTYLNPMSDPNTFVHELYHQIQYNQNPLCQIGLIKEFFLNKQMAKNGSIIGYEPHSLHDGGIYNTPIYDGKTVDNYTYKYGWNLSKYNTLDDLPFLESQAQFVGDYAELYYNARFNGGISYSDENKLKEMSRIMKNSGYEETEAVKWIESNIE